MRTLIFFSLCLTPSIALPFILGAMGDSFTRGYFNRNGPCQNWVEQLVNSRGVNFGPLADYPDIRKKSYAFDWPGADAQSAVQDLAPGLAAQIRAGELKYAVLEIGSHDFGPAPSDPPFPDAGQNVYQSLYEGRLAGDNLARYSTQALVRVFTAADEISSAGGALILATIPDFGITPRILRDPAYADACKRRRVTQAIADANLDLLQRASRREIPVIDFFAFLNEVRQDPVVVGGVALYPDRVDFPTNPEDYFLDEEHPGTVASGLFANLVLLALKEQYGIEVPLLSDQEILRNAGIAPPTEEPTYVDLERFVTVSRR